MGPEIGQRVWSADRLAPGQAVEEVGLTILVPAAQRVEGFLAKDDLLGNDPEAVDISFLRDVGLAQVLRGSPQVCV